MKVIFLSPSPRDAVTLNFSVKGKNNVGFTLLNVGIYHGANLS